ncbi:MAG TPA: DNA-directed RNA polymerase subunit delta [Candidatus Onthocola stercoravium]|nr:DNA-directed RNA polymerase subunit delta [Candidatus Onthocola stercoravium]
MKLSEIPKEELELMGYDDIAAVILQESGKKMKLQDIFKKVCKALDLPDSVVEDQLMDFFELMSINKKFIMLKNGYWDLQTRHKLDIVIEDEEEDEEELEIEDEEIEDIEEPEEDDIFYDKDDETEDVDDDDLADLVVIDSEDEANM